MIRTVVIGAVALAAAGALWVRLAPSDPARFHVDPLAAARSKTPNDAMLTLSESPMFDRAPAALLDALETVALAEPRTSVLAREGDGVTFIQRSRAMGFPDYISVRAVSLCQRQTMLTIWSRSRFGYSDMGVNAARIERWMAALSGAVPLAPQASAPQVAQAPAAPPAQAFAPPASAVFRMGRAAFPRRDAATGAYRAPWPARLNLRPAE